MATKVKLKLFVNTKTATVLFAEAEKDFIDFLCHFLSLPVGTVAKLLKEKGMVGCLRNVYKSVENLSEVYWLSSQFKSSLLNPKAPIIATEIPLLLSDYDLQNRKLYSCPVCSHYYVADVPNLLCPQCKQKMTYLSSYVPPSPANVGITVEGGFVIRLATFIVMDNLEFLPISSESLVALLDKSSVKEVGAIEKVDVELGVDEGLKLLKLSLECETVLTSFYLERQASYIEEASEE